ncbi:hypothetical protein QLQ12_13700 [Actinoplanes sp. NEAU-A12]|uniref:Uncharacterized protein n=1 Tax=Actinoplanes sandaracinus TaxID=3045177 RepID=A0ABT6WIW0_9ACTN|nr:hypothetical protein [Actinoplanes sandaracinus]MDI6099652.1 hypothetical protein [Actinoplanes sandaracinus]
MTVTNPYPFPINVHSIQARVAETSRWRCKPTATNLKVGPFSGRLPLAVSARGQKAAGELEVTMPKTVADACQKATFRLVFTATASRTAR